MTRTLRRWLALSFAVVLAVSVAATCLWSWYDFRKSSLEERKIRAMDCAALTQRSLSHSGFGTSRKGFGMAYAFDRDTMRKLCQVFEMDYLYVYVVAEDRQSITYLVCVASDDEADKTVQETRAPGTVIEIQLEKDEHRILDGELDAALIQTDNENGRELTWIVPYRDPYGEIVAMIGADFGFQVTQRLLFQRTMRQLIPILLSMLLAYVVLLLLVTRRVVQPIRKISARMNSFVADRDKNPEPLAINSVGEIMEISESFEKMRSDINDYLARIGDLTKQQLEADVQMEVARRIQQGLVPERTDLKGPGWELAAISRPTRMVGGDFYDCFDRDGKVCALVGDVSGKGVSAAMFMSSAKTLLQEKLLSGLGPAAALNAANDALCGMNPEGLFATVFVGVLDPATGEFRYANAGHTRPLLFGADAELLSPDPGIALGLFEDAGIVEEQMRFAPGAGILLYTDGLTEARSERSGFFGEERLLALGASLPAGSSAAGTLDAVSAALDAFVGGGDQFDDQAILALRRMQNSDSDWEELPLELASFDTVKKRVFSLLGQSPAARLALLACDELLTNVVSYSGAKRLRFRCRLEGEQLRADFADDGIPFDPTAEPKEPESFESMSEGGMGLGIIHQTARSMTYERRADENRLSLWFSTE